MHSVCCWSSRKNFFKFPLEFLDPIKAIPQKTPGSSKIEPVIYLIGEIRNQFVIHHLRALPKVGNVLARMTTGLGDKESEVFHEFDADRLLGVYLRMLDRLPDRRVEVFFSAPELEEECLMVDPRTEKGDFVVRDIDPFRDHLARSLHTMSESNLRATCGGVDP